MNIKRAVSVIAMLPVMATMFVGNAQASSQQKGIDVSSYQHPSGDSINWRGVRNAGYTFAFIKATEGNYYVNPYYASDLKAARAAGIMAESYVFANPRVSQNGAPTADYLLNHGGNTGIPVLDIEWNPYGGSNTCYGESPHYLYNWIWWFDYEVKKRTGGYPSINTPASWWNQCMKGYTSEFSDRWLWLENSTPSAPIPVMPQGWASWHWWQNNQSGNVPGIHGHVDIDITHP